MKKLTLLLCLVATLSLTGCQHYQAAPGEGQAVGTVLGGVGGALIGSTIGGGDGRLVATAAGAILGGLFGSHIGSGYDQAGEFGPHMQGGMKCQTGPVQYVDGYGGSRSGGCSSRGHTNCSNGDKYSERYARCYNSFHHATDADMGHTVYWKDKYAGTYGSVRAVRDGINNKGLYCREFQTTVYVDGRAERLFGQACRMKDGRWMPI